MVPTDQGPGGPCQVDPTYLKPHRPASGPGDLIHYLDDLERPQAMLSRSQKTRRAYSARLSLGRGMAPPVGLHIAGFTL
jgi:hypothetical protein